MTLKELQAALTSPDPSKRAAALRQFRDGAFGLEALPLLRELMTGDDVTLVILAVECVAKLGSEALGCPAGQAYSGAGNDVPGELEWHSACLDALVKLEADEDGLVEYIHNHIGLNDPDDFLNSIKALRRIDTPEARNLAKRAIAFWRPALNKTQAKQLEKLLAAK